jgi:DNA-binding response OmpR family regulator
MLRIVLENSGYQVREAANGKIALDIFTQSPSDLIITDLIMPDKEGIELIMQVRRSHPEVKIIAMSGGGRINPLDYLNLAQKFGADYSIAKPFSNRELLDKVKMVLEL